jgi:hypothetical protein
MKYTAYCLAVAFISTAPGFGQSLEQTVQPASMASTDSAVGPQTISFLQGSPGSSAGPVCPAGAPCPPSVANSIPEKLTIFDPGSAEVRWLDNRWQLLAGGIWLKDFGRREAEAREAVRLIRMLHLNQHGTVGTPQPVMEYWLSDGQAPRSFSSSGHEQALDQSSLRVEETQKQWFVRDAHRVLFVFGAHREEAQAAVDIIRRHGFTQIGYVGQPMPSMIYFLGDAAGMSHGRAMASQRTLVSRTANHGRHAALKTASGEVSPAVLPDAAQPEKEKALTAVAVPTAPQLATISPVVAGQPALGDRVAFDCRQLQVRLDGNDWKLCWGGYTIAGFGSNVAEAQRAMEVLQCYRCNEHCLVGRPTPICSFFLCANQAPRGMAFGLSGQSFRTEDLTVRRQCLEWSIGDAHQTLLRFGTHEIEAKAMLHIIQQHKFDLLAHIGAGEASGMTIFIRTQ